MGELTQLLYVWQVVERVTPCGDVAATAFFVQPCHAIKGHRKTCAVAYSHLRDGSAIEGMKRVTALRKGDRVPVRWDPRAAAVCRCPVATAVGPMRPSWTWGHLNCDGGTCGACRTY